MSERPVFIASDVHLGAAPPEHEEAFLSWLAQAADRASSVVLNGDVFDFWFEYQWGVTGGHDRALGVLRDVVSAGVPVTLLGGNHDWWGGRYLTEVTGVEFLRDPVIRQLSGFNTFIAHGDGLDPADRGYRYLKWILRGWPTRLAFSLLPPALGDRIAKGVSSTTERWGGPTAHDRECAGALGDWAAAKMVAEPEIDLVLLGHTHVPQVRSVDAGRWYVNLGDWVHHKTYLVLEEGAAPQLMTWNGDAPPSPWQG